MAERSSPKQFGLRKSQFHIDGLHSNCLDFRTAWLSFIPVPKSYRLRRLDWKQTQIFAYLIVDSLQIWKTTPRRRALMPTVSKFYDYQSLLANMLWKRMVVIPTKPLSVNCRSSAHCKIGVSHVMLVKCRCSRSSNMQQFVHENNGLYATHFPLNSPRVPSSRNTFVFLPTLLWKRRFRCFFAFRWSNGELTKL